MESLGLDIRLLLAQIVNFTILLFILNKVLYKPLMRLLDDRSKKVNESLKKSEEIEDKLNSIEEKEKKILNEAQMKAKKEKDELISLANLEKEKIISDAKLASEKEVQKSIERIKSFRSQLADELKDEFMEDVVEKLSTKLAAESKKKKHPILRQVLNDEK